MGNRLHRRVLWSVLIAGTFLAQNPAMSDADTGSASSLPRVLIIGDSISIGYTPFVAESLAGRVRVHHHPGNAQHTGTGLEKLDEWLGTEGWDLIQFNWGLWDLCYRHPESEVQGRRDKERGQLTTSLKVYGENLERLVKRLKATDAKLIWANTTVVPPGEAGRVLGDDLRYNQVAAEIMNRHGIAIADLNTVSREFEPDWFVGPGNVHFTKDGYRALARFVERGIVTALGLAETPATR